MNQTSQTSQTSIEMDKSKIDFKFLWKIKEIDVNVVTLEKYAIHREKSFDENKSVVILREYIGLEIHKATPDVQLELSGKVGDIIKNFEVGKQNNAVRIKKIIWL